MLGGVPLGDCWRHPSLEIADATSELMPLHKLSQWLAYSLVEPLEASGLNVVDIDGLAGLAEYRNGGLLIDTKARPDLGKHVGRDQNRCARGGAEAHPRSPSICRLARTGLDCGSAAEPARHAEPSGTDAGRYHIVAAESRIWRTWNFAALARGGTPANVSEALIKELLLGYDAPSR